MAAAKPVVAEKISQVKREHDDGQATRRACCGKKRIILVVVTVLAIALGVGLGVGLSMQKAVSASAASAQGQAGVASATTTRALTSTTNAGSVAATATRPPKQYVPDTACPGSNGTTAEFYDHTYLLLCGSDIQAPGKTDLGHGYQPRFTECISNCARLGGNRTDVSAVYWLDYDLSVRGTCWCFGGTSRAGGAVPTSFAANSLAWIQS